MSETGKKILVAVLAAALFIVCVVLVVIGQRNVGPAGLLTMLAGLAGLVALLWFYNRGFK